MFILHMPHFVVIFLNVCFYYACLIFIFKKWNCCSEIQLMVFECNDSEMNVASVLYVIVIMVYIEEVGHHPPVAM